VTPRVTIGVPVFNGERYLADALDSILAQTFGDFELIISDNASTDRSGQIAARYAEADPRVRFVRNETNIGGPANFNRLLDLATGEYFKWAACDDMIAPDYLACCVEILDADRDVMMASTRIAIVDENGAVLRPLSRDIRDSDSRSPARRLKGLVLTRHGAFQVWGLMRTDAARAAGGHRPLPMGDRVLLVELALQGRIHLVNRELLMIRDHPGRTVRRLRSNYRRLEWHDPGRSSLMPHWEVLRLYSRAIAGAPLSRSERRACRFVLLRWLFFSWNWAKLAMDLLVRLNPRFIDLYEAVAGHLRQRRAARRRGGVADRVETLRDS
jgi:glycosyltransferase involved in cell wall biosynthesis